MLGIDPRRFACVGLLRDDVVPPEVATRLDRDRGTGALPHEHGLDALAVAHRERLVDHRLQRDLAPAAKLAVGGDDGDRARVDDPLLNALRGKPAEHDRVRGADAGACLHRDDRLDRHRHVHEHAIARLDALRLQRVREAAYLVIEILVADAGDRAVVGLEDDRDLVRLRREVPVEAVVRRVELAVVEPFVERRVRFVERLGKGLLPQQLGAGMLGPETLEVALGLRAHRVVSLHARDVGLADEVRRGRKHTAFGQYRFDRRRHVAVLLRKWFQRSGKSPSLPKGSERAQ